MLGAEPAVSGIINVVRQDINGKTYGIADRERGPSVFIHEDRCPIDLIKVGQSVTCAVEPPRSGEKLFARKTTAAKNYHGGEGLTLRRLLM